MINRNDLYQLDYGLTMSVQALIESFGMMSENLSRIQRNEPIAYPDSAFHELIGRHGIHHNTIMERWFPK